jgi:hypothetical protein
MRRILFLSETVFSKKGLRPNGGFFPLYIKGEVTGTLRLNGEGI